MSCLLRDGGARWNAQQRKLSSQADVISLPLPLFHKLRFIGAGLYLKAEDGVMRHLRLSGRHLGLVSLSGFNLVVYSNVRSSSSDASQQMREDVK